MVSTQAKLKPSKRAVVAPRVINRMAQSNKRLQRTGISVSLIDNLPQAAVASRPLKRSVMRHNMRFLLAIIIPTFLLSACHQEPKPIARSTVMPTPVVARGVAPSEAKAAFDSAQALTKLLEQRWPVAAIQGFCIPERRHNSRYQNLVAFAPRWEGTLHHDVATDFDEISWYATVKNGRADQFSLGVRRGKDFWVLEGGDEESLQRPPEFSPDPTKDWFVGHK